MTKHKAISILTYSVIIVSLIVATFLEKIFGTTTAYSLILGNNFLAIMWIIGCGLLIRQISKFKKTLKNAPIILIHAAMILILLGGATTRIFGKTGYIYLKKGDTVISYVQINNSQSKKTLAKLPFALTLNDFKINNYHGSSMASSYTSYVTVFDNANQKGFKSEIFMNNPLKHKKIRIYQTSFDEKNGVTLSVNDDFYGILITYSAYFLLLMSLAVSLFNKNGKLRRLISHPLINSKATVLIILFSLGATNLYSNDITPSLIPNKECSELIGKIWGQDGKGRFKPVNTIATELLLKLTKKSKYKSLSPEQFLVSIMSYPMKWNNEKFIKINSDSLKRLIGVDSDYVSLIDLVDSNGVYKLSDLHYRTIAKGNKTNKLEKEILSLSEKINIYLEIQRGEFLKIFPDKNDMTLPWLSPADKLPVTGKMDSLFIKKSIVIFLTSVKESNFDKSLEIVSGIGRYQTKYASDIIPNNFKRKAEIYLNKYHPFTSLFKIYGGFGFSIILFFYISLLTGKVFKRIKVVQIVHIKIFSTIHFLSILLRVYISGHAPFSNGYEIMLSLALFSVWIGLLLRKKSHFLLGVGSIFGCLCLLVANFSFMNPEITNLVPVLKSNWLSVHVTTIIIGYTFAGLATVSSLLNLIITFFIKKENFKIIDSHLQKITIINKIFIWLGIYFMIFGIITGAVWANESWGNYWSWDPKETWALITLFIYAILAHLKKMPIVRFNILTIISFISVLITYFGVNYYFGGMHSYAGGSVISFLIPTLIVALILGIIFTFSSYRWNRAKP